MKTLADRIAEETMSDNRSNYAQCKNCKYRDKYNHQKYFCDKYPADEGGKPDEFLLNKKKCEYREESKALDKACAAFYYD